MLGICGFVVLFENDCNTGAISSVFTNFYVDHHEPLEALAIYKASGGWILGELLEGHKYVPSHFIHQHSGSCH